MSIKFHEDESSTNVIGDTVQLIIERKDKTITESFITLSPNAVFDIENSTAEIAERANLHIDENELQIEWQEEETILTIAINLIDEGEVEISSSYLLAGVLHQLNTLKLLVNQADNSPLEEGSTDMDLEFDIPHNPPTVEDVEENLDEGQNTQDESNQYSDIEIPMDTLVEEEVDSLIELEEENFTQDSKVDSSGTSFKGSSFEHETLSVSQASNDFVEVGNASDFQNALKNSKVTKIKITNKFNVDSFIDMVGDKTIDGNGQVINFYGYRINIGEYHLAVKDLTIEAVHSTATDASVFQSNHSNATLSIRDTSYASPQRAQVARLTKGHVYFSGNLHFETTGPLEVLEAKNITFEKDTNFTGITLGYLSGNQKEVINLYNSPTITVGENASVRLETSGKKSVLRVDDNTPATIKVLEGGKLLIYSDNNTGVLPKTASLVSLLGEGSSIILAQNTTFDIRYFRDRKNLGSLLNMNGNLIMSDQLSRVAFWEKGANADNQFGNLYRYFPEVINGSWNIQGEQITSGTANANTSLSISDDPNKSGQTFQTVFSGRSTDDIKRLLISPVAVNSVLELEVPDRLNFQPTELGYEEMVIPRENQAWAMRVKDTRRQAHAWEITAQAEAPLTTRRGHKLDEDALVFVKNNQTYSLKEAVLIQDGVTGSSPETLIEWQADEGILLKINPMSTKIVTDMEYKTNIIWTIQDAP